MAKIRKKGVIGEITGKVGQIVVRYSNGQYIITTPPVFTKPPTEKQVEHREKFIEAVDYAKNATSTSPTKEVYGTIADQKKKFPMNVAVADFFHAPEIHGVDLESYSGKADEQIMVKTKDDVMVTRVALLISDGNGVEVERGDAEKESDLEWKYATKNVVGTADATVVVTVNDLAGNVVEKSLEKTVGE